MNLILCADLHLKESEKEYSFSVLREIISLCREKNSGALLLAGDIFDSRQDLIALRSDFRNAMEELPASCTVLFLPGNHEELRAFNGESIDNFDFGRAFLLSKKPWSLYDLTEDIEILAIPFQSNYSDYKDYDVPPKNKKLRILLAHSAIAGMTYTGEDEENTSIMDEEIFNFFQIDMAAMGHIHKGLNIKRDKYRILYPGSARIWREGETGKRCVYYCNMKNPQAAPEALYLKSAGEYRILPVYANPEGQLKVDMDSDFSAQDSLMLELYGLVEDEKSVLDSLEKMKKELEKNYRKVSSKIDKLSVLSGISTHPLAKRFLAEWEAKAENYQKEEKEVYELARLRGLLTLKSILEKRK